MMEKEIEELKSRLKMYEPLPQDLKQMKGREKRGEWYSGPKAPASKRRAVDDNGGAEPYPKKMRRILEVKGVEDSQETSAAGGDATGGDATGGNANIHVCLIL